MKDNDHKHCLALLEEAQDADKDNREAVREAHAFLNKRDGQWEPEVWSKRRGQPRYTFDKCNPIVNQIAGAIKKADFDIKIRPAGGDASKETAELFDGIIRNIETTSNASTIYSRAGRNMVAAGVDGWMVVQKWADAESFDQELAIEYIPNFWDSVFFDTNSQMPDRSDAEWAHKLTAMSKRAYEEKYPEGSGTSVGQGKSFSTYYNKPDQVIVGEYYWIKQTTKTLVQMSNGAVYVEDEEFAKVADELAALGVTEKSRRTRPARSVWLRHYDGSGWLDEAQETVFEWIPLIPAYANFNIVDNKIIYHGVIEKLLDAQRVHNYVMSRYVGDVALSPKPKLWMTPEQAAGHTQKLATMNTNNDPVALYNHIEGQQPPYRDGGALPSPALSELSAITTTAITQASGLFASNMGDNPSLQSGVAIEQLQERGDTGTIDYFQSLEVAICHTAKIIVNAIPKVYDSERLVRILYEDGTHDMLTLNNVVTDQQTGEPVVLNDVSKGRYDVTCSAGKSFSSRRQESVAAILEMAQVDPTIIQEGSDVLLKNAGAAGLDIIAERKRASLLKAGIIPESQWTDEEIQQVQQAAQNPQPDAAMLLAQAEMLKAQAEQANAQNKQAELQLKAMELQQRSQLDAAKLGQKGQADAISAQQKQREFDLKLEAMAQQIALANQKEMRETQQAVISMQKTMAETLNLIKQSMGVDAIVSPTVVNAYQEQAENLGESL